MERRSGQEDCTGALFSFVGLVLGGILMDADDSTILKQLVEQIIVGSSGIEIQFKCGVSIEKDYE